MPKYRAPLFTALLISLGAFASGANADEQIPLPGDFATGMGTWVVNTMEHTAASTASEPGDQGKTAVHITVPKAGDKRYYVQLVCKGVPLHSGTTYHLHFRAHSKPDCEISVVTGSYQGKFTELSRQDHVALAGKWADYTCDFSPKENDDTAQVIFGGLAAQAGEYWFENVSLTEGN